MRSITSFATCRFIEIVSLEPCDNILELCSKNQDSRAASLPCSLGLTTSAQRRDYASSPVGGAKKPRSEERGFFICVRRTQHHLTEGQHHFEQSENIILHLCGHQTMLQQVANDVMHRINDVGYAQRCCALRKRIDNRTLL